MKQACCTGAGRSLVLGQIRGAPPASTRTRELVLEELTWEQILDWYSRTADHQLVSHDIDRYGETSAQRRSPGVRCQAQRLGDDLGHLDLDYTTGGSHERRRAAGAYRAYARREAPLADRS